MPALPQFSEFGFQGLPRRLLFPKAPQRLPAYRIKKTQRLPNRRTRRQAQLQTQYTSLRPTSMPPSIVTETGT